MSNARGRRRLQCRLPRALLRTINREAGHRIIKLCQAATARSSPAGGQNRRGLLWPTRRARGRPARAHIAARACPWRKRKALIGVRAAAGGKPCNLAPDSSTAARLLARQATKRASRPTSSPPSHERFDDDHARLTIKARRIDEHVSRAYVLLPASPRAKPPATSSLRRPADIARRLIASTRARMLRRESRAGGA